jgi:hypothetical protein
VLSGAAGGLRAAAVQDRFSGQRVRLRREPWSFPTFCGPRAMPL